MIHATKKPKPRPCPECGEPFIKFKMGQKCCTNPECAVSAGRKIRAAKEAKAMAAERKITREKLAQHERKSVLEQRARKAVQEYRREKDLKDGYGCISCGKYPGSVELSLYGHEFDGGHFIPVGRNKSLSLEPRNIHAQCVHCNRDLKGNYGEYRKRLITRYSVDYVESLESDQSPKHYTREELIEIAKGYRAKTRALKKA